MSPSKFRFPSIGGALIAGALIAAALSLVVTCADATPREPIYVGVLEDIQSDSLSPAMSRPHVRVAFAVARGEWSPMPMQFDTLEALEHSDLGYPREVSWTVVLDGRASGSVHSRASGPAERYGDVGIQQLAPPSSKLPVITSGAASFTYAGGIASRRRPLLLVSVANVHDPDRWKPTVLSAREWSQAIALFRSEIPLLEHCDRPDQQPFEHIAYDDREIVLVKAYRSAAGERLVGLRLERRRSGCNMDYDDEWLDRWYAWPRMGPAHLIGTQMVPLEAADVDASGHSAWVFQISRDEATDGYQVFYADFGKTATYLWSYH